MPNNHLVVVKFSESQISDSTMHHTMVRWWHVHGWGRVLFYWFWGFVSVFW